MGCPRYVTKKNWVGRDRYPDRFRIYQWRNRIVVRRLDRRSGWGMRLKIRCSRGMAEEVEDEFALGDDFEENVGDVDEPELDTSVDAEAWAEFALAENAK